MASFLLNDVRATEIYTLSLQDALPVLLPRFVLRTGWSIMGLVYAALVLIFTGSLYWLVRTSSNVDLYEISRIEGE